MSRANTDTRSPSSIAREISTRLVATRGLDSAYWIVRSIEEQVVEMVRKQIRDHPEEWEDSAVQKDLLRHTLQSTQSEEKKTRKIPPPPVFVP